MHICFTNRICNVKAQFSSEKSATNKDFGARQNLTDKSK